jgi:hypothetical protein
MASTVLSSAEELLSRRVAAAHLEAPPGAWRRRISRHLQARGGGARPPSAWRRRSAAWGDMAPSLADAGLTGGGSSRRRWWQSSSQISTWTRSLFNFIARDPIAFSFVCRDLIAFSYSVAWLRSCSLPNIIPPEPSSSHTTYQTGQDKTHLCVMGIAVLSLVEVR